MSLRFWSQNALFRFFCHNPFFFLIQELVNVENYEICQTQYIFLNISSIISHRHPLSAYFICSLAYSNKDKKKKRGWNNEIQYSGWRKSSSKGIFKWLNVRRLNSYSYPKPQILSYWYLSFVWSVPRKNLKRWHFYLFVSYLLHFTCHLLIQNSCFQKVF